MEPKLPTTVRSVFYGRRWEEVYPAVCAEADGVETKKLFLITNISAGVQGRIPIGENVPAREVRTMRTLGAGGIFRRILAGEFSGHLKGEGKIIGSKHQTFFFSRTKAYPILYRKCTIQLKRSRYK